VIYRNESLHFDGKNRSLQRFVDHLALRSRGSRKRRRRPFLVPYSIMFMGTKGHTSSGHTSS
jgi:hypothetical protein